MSGLLDAITKDDGLIRDEVELVRLGCVGGSLTSGRRLGQQTKRRRTSTYQAEYRKRLEQAERDAQ